MDPSTTVSPAENTRTQWNHNSRTQLRSTQSNADMEVMSRPRYIRENNQRYRIHQRLERQRNYYMEYYIRRLRTNGAIPEIESFEFRNNLNQNGRQASTMIGSIEFVPPVPETGFAQATEALTRAFAASTANPGPESSPRPTDDFLQGIIQGAIVTLQETTNTNDDSSMFNLTASRHHNGLTKQEINRHTVAYEYKPKKRKRMKDINERSNNSIPNENEVCSICLDRFCTNITVRRLPCLHVFHIKCIDKWLKQNKKCPICRIVITINYDNLLSSLQSGNSIEQCLSQQEPPNHISFLIQELNEVRRTLDESRAQIQEEELRQQNRMNEEISSESSGPSNELPSPDNRNDAN